MNVLVIGGSGTLGSDLAKILAEKHQVYAPPHAAVDALIPDQIRRALDTTRADVVVNCAALADVDRCEREPDRAFELNADAPRYIAQACRERHAMLIQISTDYVFDGKKGEPYLEADATRPLQVYGKSKLSGENAALEVAGKALVIRTSWLFGARGKNFPNRVLQAAKEGGEIKAVSDWYGSPTSTVDLSRAIGALAEGGATGVVHVSHGGEAQSRLEQAREILGRFPSHEATLTPVSSSTLLHLDAERPRYTALASERLASLGIRLRPRAEAVAEFAA